MLYTMTITDKIKFEQSPTIPVHELVSIAHNLVIWYFEITHLLITRIKYNFGVIER